MNKPNEMQLFNESLMLDDRFNIPRLMNMSFNPNSAENDNNKRKTSRFDREWITSSKQQETTAIDSSSQYTSQKEFYNDNNKNFDYKQRNNFMNNKKPFNKNNSWNRNQPWRNNNNRYQNNRYVNNYNQDINKNSNIEDMCITSDIDDDDIYDNNNKHTTNGDKS